MKLIDISTNDAMAKTLPSAGKIVKFYNRFSVPFVGKVEFNQWYRPIFYKLVNDDWCRINLVPLGWDELVNLKEAGTSAGEYADMSVFRGTTK